MVYVLNKLSLYNPSKSGRYTTLVWRCMFYIHYTHLPTLTHINSNLTVRICINRNPSENCNAHTHTELYSWKFFYPIPGIDFQSAQSTHTHFKHLSYVCALDIYLFYMWNKNPITFAMNLKGLLETDIIVYVVSTVAAHIDK